MGHCHDCSECKRRLRDTAQILIAAVGADGPMDAEDAARKAVAALAVAREAYRRLALIVDVK